MPYTIMLIVVVAMPTLILSSEIVRMMFVDVHLQTAVDAACAAASQSVDMPHFIATGEVVIDVFSASANAQREFDSTVQNAGINQYNPGLGAISLLTPSSVYCTGNAVMTWMLPGISTVTLTAESAAEARAVQ